MERVLSIVIPTPNEAATLAELLPRLRARAVAADDHHEGDAVVELIVSDCDSADGTAGAADRLADRVVRGARTRAQALNDGAAVARGEMLLFLHADSVPPPAFARLIRQTLGRPDFVGGAFDFQFLPANAPVRSRRRLDPPKLALVRLCNRFRFRYTRNFYGDQGIFVLTEVFRRLGGFPACALLEDVRFSRALNRLGRTAILNPPMLTSPRRFLARGVLTQLAQDMLLLGCDAFCVEPDGLWQRYNGWNHHGDGYARPERGG
jgi:glycosyltransferase involved in cell wall biosynthesis